MQHICTHIQTDIDRPMDTYPTPRSQTYSSYLFNFLDRASWAVRKTTRFHWNLMASMTSSLQILPARPLRSTKEEWDSSIFCQPKARHLRRCPDGYKHHFLRFPSSQLCCCTGSVRRAAHHLRDSFFMPAWRQKWKLSQMKNTSWYFVAHLGVWPEIHTAYLGTKTLQRRTNILPWRNVSASLSDWSIGLSLGLNETQILIQ